MADKDKDEATPAQLQTELVGAIPFGWLPVDQGLPQSIDDAEAMFGIDIYDRMLHSPDLQGLFNGLRSAILEQGWMVSPAVKKPHFNADASEIAEYERAEELADFVRKQIESLNHNGGRGFYSLLWESLNTLAKGHVLAEVTYHVLTSGKWKGKLGLKSIKTKPRQNYAIVVDAYNNFIGVTARQPGKQFIVRVGYIGNAHDVPSFIGRDKFILFNWDVVDDDPRGTSLLRGCYRPWKKEQTIEPQRVKYAVQFGGGRILIVRGERSAENPGVAGESNAEVLKKGKEWSAGGVLVLEPGADGRVVMPETDTKIFLNEAEDIRKQYALALTTSVRAFLEAQHGSKADSAQGDKLLDAFIGAVHNHVEPIIAAQLIRPLIRLNFGEELADTLLPIFSLKAGGKDDFSSNAEAVSKLVSAGMVTEPMKAEIAREKLGIEYLPGEEKEEVTPGDEDPKNSRKKVDDEGQ